MDEVEVGRLISKTQELAKNGKYELFKTTSHFDYDKRVTPTGSAQTVRQFKNSAPQLPG